MCEVVTKTCKVCGETKEKDLFPIKRLICKKCKNHQERIKYFAKRNQPLKSKKQTFTSEEERKAYKKIYLKERDKKLRDSLSDEYIKDHIRSLSWRNKSEPDFSETNIIKVRKSIQEFRETKKTGYKQCKCCKKVLKVNEFYQSIFCKKCHYKSHYEKYSRGPYTKKIGHIQKLRTQFNRENLTDVYLKALIKSNFKTSFRILNNDIPQEFVELKRKELILKRKIESHGKEKAPN